MALLKDAKEITIPDYRYYRLEYLEGDGLNYIITNTVVNVNAEYWLELSFKSGQVNALSGSEKSNSYSTNDRFKLGTSASGALFCGFANGFGSQMPVENRFYEFYVKQGSQYIKDTETGTTLATRTYSLTGTNLGTANIVLFGIARASNTDIINVSNNAGTRIKRYAVLYQGNLAEFLPVKRKSDNALGFYNTRNNIFYEQQGTGSLIEGPVVADYAPGRVYKIADESRVIWGNAQAYPYRRLEYIHFSGAEGIDLGFKPASTGNTGVQAVNARITGPQASGTYGIILGCAGDSAASGGTMRVLIQSIGNSGAQLAQIGQRVGRNSSTFGYNTMMDPDEFYSFRLRTTSNSSTYIDIYNESGRLISGTNHTTSVSYTSANMPNENLMRYNSGGSIVSNGYSTGEIQWFKQWDGSQATGTLIKNMYPCQRKSDNVCGLYDVLNRRFYPMQGTNITTAAAGPLVDEYWDLTA